VEVLPLVHAKRIPQSPAGMAGIFDYHGAPVPLIDLAELALGKPSQLVTASLAASSLGSPF
jgi:chemotaxis-related protein WspB